MDDNNIQNEKDIIDLGKVFKTLWEKRKTFYIVLPIVFVLSCIWIFPQPRYYTCEVKLAPESGGEDATGGLASVASSFGFNIGDAGSSDAIYPMLYPELFESPEFIASLFEIKVTTYSGELTTDYYTYLLRHQIKNPLTQPFLTAKYKLTLLLSGEGKPAARKTTEKLNPFKMNSIDYGIADMITKNITCKVDKKTEVISIKVEDQDRQVCALLADSIKERLQQFIIDYRTKKARADVKYYQHLTDSAKIEYEKSLAAYGNYHDGHRNLIMNTFIEQGDKLKNDLEVKLTTYNTFNAQLASAKAKVQERTPSFTTLKSASIPKDPDRPKRSIFVLAMLFVATAVTTVWILRREIRSFFHVKRTSDAEKTLFKIVEG